MKREDLINLFTSCTTSAEIYEVLDLGYSSTIPKEAKLQWFKEFQELVLTEEDIIAQNQKDIDAGVTVYCAAQQEETPPTLEETRQMICAAQKIWWND